MLSRLTFNKMSVGQRLVGFYLCLTYVFPLVANTVLGNRIESPYKVYPLTAFAFWSLAVTFLLYLCLSNVRLGFAPSFGVLRRFAVRAGELYARWRFKLAIFCVPFCFLYLVMGLTSYRYTAVSISERQSMTLILGMVLQCGLWIDLFWTLFIQSKQSVVVRTRLWWENVLLSFSLLMLSSGTADVFLALFAVFYSVAPATFKKIYFPKIDRTLKQRLAGFSVSVLVAVLIFALAWPCGEMTKIASSRAVEVPSSDGGFVPRKPRLLWGGMLQVDSLAAHNNRERLKENLRWFVRADGLLAAVKRRLFGGRGQTVREPEYQAKKPSLWKAFKGTAKEFTPVTYALYIVQGLSVHYYAHLFLTATPRKELTLRLVDTPVLFPLSTMFFRADHMAWGLMGLQRPDVTSISVLNYRLMSKTALNRREGTSPGLVGSFEYVLAFPWWIFATVLYLLFVTRIFDGLFYRGANETLSLVACFVGLKYVDIFFGAPADFLLVLDNGFIKLLLLLGVYLACSARETQTHERKESKFAQTLRNASTT